MCSETVEERVERYFQEGHNFDMEKILTEVSAEHYFTEHPMGLVRDEDTDPILLFDPDEKKISMIFGYYPDPDEAFIFHQTAGQIDIAHYAKDENERHRKYKMPRSNHQFIRTLAHEVQKYTPSTEPATLLLHTSLPELKDVMKSIIEYHDAFTQQAHR